MAYSYDFKDNVVYGADDINAIRTSIMTKGVIEESDSSCKVVALESGVKILQGQAVFDDGCRIEVDSEGVEREVVSGAVNYIYFSNNTLAGVCEVIASTAAPEGDYVLLAETDGYGNITDRREFSQAKTADTERYIASFNEEIWLEDTVGATATVTLPKSNCSMIEFDLNFASNGWWNVKVFPKEDGRVLWRYPNGVFYCGETMSFSCIGKTRNIRYTVTGNVMTLKMESISSADSELKKLVLTGYCVR